MGMAGEATGFYPGKSVRERVRATLSGADEFRAFNYTYLLKVGLMLFPLEIALILFIKHLSIDFSGFPIEGIVVLSAFSISVTAVYVFLMWRLWKPVLIIRIDKLKYNHIALWRGIEIEWDRIEGLIEDEAPNSRLKSVKVLKIVYRKMNNKIDQIVLNQNMLHKGKEAFSLLKKIIPPGPSADVYRRLEELKRSPKTDVRYKNIVLNDQGLNVPSKVSNKTAVIPWDSITALIPEDDLAAGTGISAVQIEFTRMAKKGRLVLRDIISKEFLDFIKLVMAHTRRDAIDPRLFQLLEPRETAPKVDPVVAFFIISGFILAIVGMIILMFYPPTIASTWIYPLLLIPFSLCPLILTFKLQLSKNPEKASIRSKSIIAGLGFNLGTIGAIAILFMLSPASFSWLVADANALCGRMDAAVIHYQKAEKDLSDNSDFLFSLGQLYYKKKDWENAAHYYIRAYQKDPTNWFAEPLEKIPDSLFKAGLTDEALTWCDKIIQSYSGRPDVIRVIEQKRKEIAGTVS
jgi:hypothetical protein